MRSRRIAAWTAGAMMAVAVIGGSTAVAVTASTGDVTADETPVRGYVTCSSPPETDGDVTISAARAERGTTIGDSGADEICTVTE